MAQAQALPQPLSASEDRPQVVDTHAHLDAPAFDADRHAVIERARRAGVEVVLMSTDLDSACRVIRLAEVHGLRCAVGLHPNEAHRLDETLEDQLRALAQRPGMVAIGEIGLDYYRTRAPRAVQHEALRRQLALAQELGLPVVLHNREASEDLLALVREFPGARGVFHSFLGTRQEAQAMLALGFYLGLGGPLTFKAREPLRQVVRELPLERLVVETDSPYLTPEPHRGQRNEPRHVRHVVEALARVKGLSLAEVARQTTANARALFGPTAGGTRRR